MYINVTSEDVVNCIRPNPPAPSTGCRVYKFEGTGSGSTSTTVDVPEGFSIPNNASLDYIAATSFTYSTIYTSDSNMMVAECASDSNGSGRIVIYHEADVFSFQIVDGKLKFDNVSVYGEDATVTEWTLIIYDNRQEV